MKLKGFRKAIYSTFTDTVTVFSYSDQSKDDGTTNTILLDEPSFSDLPCRLSYSKSDSASSDKDEVSYDTVPKLFTRVEDDIKPADFVQVSRKDSDGVVIETITGNLGVPNVYDTHKEYVIQDYRII